MKAFLFFAIAGVIGYLVDLSVTLIAAPLIGLYFARIPAFLCAATTTWLINRSITFKDKQTHTSLLKEWTHYMSLMLGGLIVNYGVYAITVHLLPNSPISVAVAIAIGSAAGMIVNFFGSSKLLYK